MIFLCPAKSSTSRDKQRNPFPSFGLHPSPLAVLPRVTGCCPSAANRPYRAQYLLFLVIFGSFHLRTPKYFLLWLTDTWICLTLHLLLPSHPRTSSRPNHHKRSPYAITYFLFIYCILLCLLRPNRNPDKPDCLGRPVPDDGHHHQHGQHRPAGRTGPHV